jgi:hypothetical protein
MLKYIRTLRAGFVLWDANGLVSHREMAEALGPKAGGLLSAGFAIVAGQSARCSGESTSLRLESSPDDSAALAVQLGLRAPAEATTGATA